MVLVSQVNNVLKCVFKYYNYSICQAITRDIFSPKSCKRKILAVFCDFLAPPETIKTQYIRSACQRVVCSKIQLWTRKKTCYIMKTRHKCKIEHALVFSIQNKHITKIWLNSVWKYYYNKTLLPEKEPFFPRNIPRSICNWQTQSRNSTFLQYDDFNFGDRMSFSAFASFTERVSFSKSLPVKRSESKWKSKESRKRANRNPLSLTHRWHALFFL